MLKHFKTIITDIQALKMNIVPTQTVEQLKLDEGKCLTLYQCSANKMTIGYGRNIEDNGITEEEADYLLMNDIKRVQKELRANFEWFGLIGTARQGALINMCFNLGLTRLMGFKKMLAAIEQEDYQEAAEQMLDSKWARQVGARADRLAKIMREGK